MLKFRLIILWLTLLFTLTACGGGEPTPLSPEDRHATAQVLADAMLILTAAAQPTDEPPTRTPTSEAETTPPGDTASIPPTNENVIFRDDFIDELEPDWYWESEIPEQWTITPDGWLEITADDAGLVNVYRQNNLLFRDIPSGDFSVSTLVRADPTTNFQQAAIFIYLDNQNYISLNHAYCSVARCKTDGSGIFMEYQIDGIWWFFSVPLTATDVYLKLTLQNNQITGYYATTPGEWIQLNFINNFAAFTKVGLSASNVDSNNLDSDLVAQFDYFEIRKP